MFFTQNTVSIRMFIWGLPGFGNPAVFSYNPFSGTNSPDYPARRL